jgi:hypothetical protein
MTNKPPYKAVNLKRMERIFMPRLLIYSLQWVIIDYHIQPVSHGDDDSTNFGFSEYPSIIGRGRY